MSALKSRISELLSTHKARKIVTVSVAVILVMSFLLFSTVNFFKKYIELQSFVSEAEYVNPIHYYTHSIQYGSIIKSREKYYLPGDDYFRFVSIEGSKLYSIFYSEGTAYLSFDTDIKSSWAIDESLLGKDELKDYIREKAEWIKESYTGGINNIGFIFKIKREYKPESDLIDGDWPGIITITSSFGKKNVKAISRSEKKGYYLDYNDGSEHFYLSTERLSTKTDTVNGTISTVEEFDKLMEENGINTTFGDIFGK